MPDDEGVALHRVALAAGRSGLGPIVEIGTYRGKSALYLGAAAAQVGCLVFSVDHHRGSEENQLGWEHHDPSIVDSHSGRIDTLPYARRAIAEADLEDHVVLVVGESTSVAAAWSTPLAMLFIDGGHGTDPAWADYTSWSPKVAVGGYLAIHDVFPDPADGGRPPYEIYRAAVDSRVIGKSRRQCPSPACASCVACVPELHTRHHGPRAGRRCLSRVAPQCQPQAAQPYQRSRNPPCDGGSWGSEVRDHHWQLAHRQAGSLGAQHQLRVDMSLPNRQRSTTGTSGSRLRAFRPWVSLAVSPKP